MTIELNDYEGMIVRAALRQYRDLITNSIEGEGGSHDAWSNVEIARTQAIIDKAAKL